MTLVTMINSVGEYAAGSEHELPVEEADRFIILGYADGELSRAYTGTECDELRRSAQQVSV